ncbi:MAG: DsbA family protein [Candidatus Tectomicrobia bacterium]|nr:DsbA family protein [Candidatus Tectomicrobia bacterium]
MTSRPLRQTRSARLLRPVLLAVLALLVSLGVPPRFAGGGAAGAAELAARFDGKPITLEEVDANVQREIMQIKSRMFDLRRRGLESLLTEHLLKAEATKRQSTVQAVYNEEIVSKVAPVTEQEARAFFERNQNRIRAPYEQVRERIHGLLRERRIEEQRERFVERLRGAYRIEMFLQPPRLQVSADDDPSTGAANALITIIEFSDFECPFCSRSQPVLKQVLSTYAEKVRLVYRDYPLETIHQRGRPAALAANCANEQGKFWEYHDLLFANQQKLSDADLQGYAKQVNLDAGKFDACFAAKKYNAEIDHDIEDGRKLGVDSTPTFYINGRLVAGAVSFNEMKKIIEEELQFQAQAKP